jgi:hypothetical protein
MSKGEIDDKITFRFFYLSLRVSAPLRDIFPCLLSNLREAPSQTISSVLDDRVAVGEEKNLRF